MICDSKEQKELLLLVIANSSFTGSDSARNLVILEDQVKAAEIKSNEKGNDNGTK